METYIKLWKYMNLAEFSLVWDIFCLQIVEKVMVRILISTYFPPKSCRFRDK
jgi:hypothetical protein